MKIKKITMTQVLSLLATALTLTSMIIGSEVHEREMQELKEEIKTELNNEKEN